MEGIRPAAARLDSFVSGQIDRIGTRHEGGNPRLGPNDKTLRLMKVWFLARQSHVRAKTTIGSSTSNRTRIATDESASACDHRKAHARIPLPPLDADRYISRQRAALWNSNSREPQRQPMAMRSTLEFQVAAPLEQQEQFQNLVFPEPIQGPRCTRRRSVTVERRVHTHSQLGPIPLDGHAGLVACVERLAAPVRANSEPIRTARRLLGQVPIPAPGA